MDRPDTRPSIAMLLRRPALCLAVSLAVHVVCLYGFGVIGRFDFGAPVAVPSVVSVDLNGPPTAPASPVTPEVDREPPPAAPAAPPAAAEAPAPAATGGESLAAEAPEVPPPAEPAELPREVAAPAPAADVKTKARPAPPPFHLPPPLRLAGEFLTSESESLRYRIYLLGMPVGSALLQATRDKGEVRISLRVTSDAVISSIYPVDDLIETRHINGNFIISTIRQKEGSFSGDRGFTIFLREKSVFWIDRLTRRSLRESIHTSEVVDLLSGLYYLRNRQLRVGSAETLHVYDSDRYLEMPVEVMRRETVRLSGVRTVEALLVVPRLESGGIFKRTGDLRIWLSDDGSRVPVKVATAIPLGPVTAELVAAEAKR